MMKATKLFRHLLAIACIGLVSSCTAETESIEELNLIEQQNASAKLSVSSVSTNGDNGNGPANTLDGNLNNRSSATGDAGKTVKIP